MKFSAAASSKGLFAAFLRTPAVNGFLVAFAGLGGGVDVDEAGDMVKA
jgi:hypothetical protein